MLAGLGSKLLVLVLVATSCCQERAPYTDSTAIPPSPRASVAARPDPNNREAKARPERSPIPLFTSDVSDPRDVSLHRFAPAEARILQVRPIREAGGVPPQLVLTWERDDQYDKELGLLLWQYTGGLQVSWKVVYLIRDRRRTAVARAGPPRDVHQTPDEIGISFVRFDLGDVTGDGHPDVLTEEHGSGTGGCAVFRVLANEGSAVHQIRIEETCETRMSLTRDGLLEIDEAAYPKWCESPHGCARRIRSLSWNSHEWVQVSERRSRL